MLLNCLKLPFIAYEVERKQIKKNIENYISAFFPLKHAGELPIFYADVLIIFVPVFVFYFLLFNIIILSNCIGDRTTYTC